MLVLTRKPGQSVYIGDDVKITLMEIRGNQVRVGVEAPSAVRIYREEIYQQIVEENRQTAAETAEVGNDLEGLSEEWSKKKLQTVEKK